MNYVNEMLSHIFVFHCFHKIDLFPMGYETKLSNGILTLSYMYIYNIVKRTFTICNLLYCGPKAFYTE